MGDCLVPFGRYRMQSWLARFETALNVVSLFADKLPDVYAEQVGRVAVGRTVDAADLFALADEAVRAIDRYAFPLTVDFFLEDEERYERAAIPVAVFGIGSDEIGDYLASGTLTLFAVATAWYPFDVTEYIDCSPFAPELLEKIFSADNTANHLVHHLSQLPAEHPARGALSTIDLIVRDSSNVFIAASFYDGCECGLEGIEWGGAWYDRLVADWVEAMPVVEAHFRFLDWLQEGGFARKVALVEYLAERRDHLE